MSKIKVLDCTLRDGGYVNDWQFGSKNIAKIINNLACSGIDFIECGFYKTENQVVDKTFYNSLDELVNFDLNKNTKFTLMINYGEVPLENIPIFKECYQNIMFRVVFKKNVRWEALDYCKKLIEKGYKVFVNPMNTISYSPSELLEIVHEVNKINPYAFTIVDTNGEMKKNDTLSLFYLIDNSLNPEIKLGFHSHNNLQLSFSNAQILLEQNTKRTLIIDTTVFGIGRGAGNLCTELLTQYLNDNYDSTYNLIPILKIVDEQINPVFAKTPWGYSVPYYLAATNHCHPNYASYLIDKQTVPVEVINKILNTIPTNKKLSFDKQFIRQLYIDFFDIPVDEQDVVKELQEKIKNKQILLVAPGHTLTSYNSEINKLISKKNLFVISLNFVPQTIRTDICFITNLKRFNILDKHDVCTIVTSNIESDEIFTQKINYSKYLNKSSLYDNAALMCIKFLNSIGVKRLYIAGLDGYQDNDVHDYCEGIYSESVSKKNTKEFNEVMSNELQNFSKNIEFCFITPTQYKHNNKG